MGLDLGKATLEFSAKDASRFKILAPVGSKSKHSWSHVGGDYGSVGSKHLVRRYRSYLSYSGDLKDGERNPILGSLPSGSGEFGLMYELKRLQRRGKGQLVLKGKLLDHDFVRQHHKELSAAFGHSVIHNHLRFDPSVDVEVPVSARQQPSFRRLGSKSGSFEFSRGPLQWSFGGMINSIGSSVSSTASSVASSVVSGTSSAVNSIAGAGSSFGNNIANGSGDIMSGIEDGFSGSGSYGGIPFKSANNIVSPLVTFGGVVSNFFGGSKSTSFNLTWPSLSISGSDGPFSASLSATPTMAGSLNFNRGYCMAWDPSTISLKFNPSLPISGQVGVDLGSASAGASTTVDGPSVSTAAPVIGEATLSSAIDFDLDLEGSLGEGVGHMGATVDFAPGAAFTLSTGHASFSNTTQHPVVTTQMPSGWDSLAPQASLTLTATPSITLRAGPTIPDAIPYVGGRGLATLDTTFANPIAFSLDLSNPDQLNIDVSGNISSQFQFFGGDVNPPLVSANLYGPINSSVAI